MKIKLYLSMLVFSLMFLGSWLSAQQESVTGYYDSANEWFVFEYTSPEYGHRKIIYDPNNKIDPEIYAYVFRDDSTGVHIYNFKVSNGNKAKQLLDTIVIKFSATIYGQTAPSIEWYMSEYRAGRTDTWKWSKTRGKPSGIPPGELQDGFSFRSKGLPAIVDMFFWGERRVRFSGPSPTYDSDEIHESFNRVFESLKIQYPNMKKTVTIKTIGPKDPPADFKPIDFLNYIISLKHEAYNLGWIKNAGIEQSLDAKFDNAKKKIEQGNIEAAKNILNAFINEVEAQGCVTYEDCSSGKHISPEAYALLKYNVQYLISNLR